MSKRENYASWDTTFMKMALVIADRSKDPSTQVGAIIVSGDNRILSAGYNGTPKGINDDEFPWGRGDGSPGCLDSKYPFVVHAERNAVLNFRGVGTQLEGSTIYVTHFPCGECAKEIVQAGVSEVVYLDKHNFEEVARIIFDAAGVSYREVEL